MDEILHFLLSHCSFLYNELGFKFVDSKVSKFFGGDSFLVLANDDLQIQFIRDRSQLFLDLRPDGVTSWYSIDLIRALINNEDIFYSIMDENNADFLKNNFQKILDLFTTEEFDGTIRGLEKLKVIRSKKLFG